MGKRYGQLGIEERTMIQTQLQMRIKPAALAGWANGYDTCTRAVEFPIRRFKDRIGRLSSESRL